MTPQPPRPQPLLENRGKCPVCGRDTLFFAFDPWLRDHYQCVVCRSLPRERALMAVVEQYYPNWRELAIHESSPANRGASRRLAQECPKYLPSHFFPGVAPGAVHQGFRCENLEALTLADASVDLHITQDVMEHVFESERVFAEIARTLKPGGAHIFTVPLVNGRQPSVTRARREADGRVTQLLPAKYHGNPISDQGSLVVTDWGFDIGQHIFRACGLFTHVIHIDDLSRGIRAELNEVLVTIKD